MKKLNQFLIFGILMSSLLAYGQANDSNELLVATVEFPPFGIVKAGAATGVATDVIQEIAKRKSLKLKEIVIPNKRIDELAEKATIFTIVNRSARREQQMRWIGKLTDDAYCFLTLKNNPPITSIAEAEKLKGIGTKNGAVSEEALAKLGKFSNFDRADGPNAGVRKLFAGQVDAVWLTQMTYAYVLKSEGKSPDEAVCTGQYLPHQYWVAASKKVPDAVFEKLKASFDELEKENFVKNSIKRF